MSKIQKFYEDILYICKRDRVNYMDAVIEYCDKNDLDVEDIGKQIRKNPLMMSRIQEEAEALNFLQKTTRLPL